MAKVGEAENASKVNMIGVGTTIEGNINSSENIRFDGILNGNLTSKGKVFIGQAGKVTGEISCKNCEVEGIIDGKVRVEELLSLRSMSKLYGEIATGKLAIEPGATFTGKCDMGGRKESAPASTPSGTRSK
ncbi:MAG: cell shape determination protein CcmA [Bacteroidetes bacterium]|nr:MAG: cell shape determination protein CcmA [Bacteroidota bacterium]